MKRFTLQKFLKFINVFLVFGIDHVLSLIRAQYHLPNLPIPSSRIFSNPPSDFPTTSYFMHTIERPTSDDVSKAFVMFLSTPLYAIKCKRDSPPVPCTISHI